MEAATGHVGVARVRWPASVDLQAVWIWALTAMPIVYLGLNGGGYDLVVRNQAGVVVWWVTLLVAAVGVAPAARLSRTGWAALALFAAFGVWSAVATTWSISTERSWAEVSRLACYLGILVLAVMTCADHRRAVRHVVAAAGTAIVAVALVALLSRLQPALFPGAQATAALLPGAQRRLGWPLNYWNALGALVAIALPLVASVASSARHLAAQAVAAAAIPALVLCEYLTFSRGGALATVLALGAFILLAPERVPKLATLAVGGAGGAGLIAGAVHRPGIEQGLASPAAADQGASLLMAMILVCAAVGLVQAGIGLATRHGTPPRFLQIPPRRAAALFGAVVVVALLVAAAAGVPGHLEHAWQQFKRPNEAGLHQDSLARYGALSGNGRYTFWKTAIDALPGHVLGGWGPGTFQLIWLPRATASSYVRNAHSLYIETLVEVGLVGLLLLAGFLAVIVVAALRRVADGGAGTRVHAAAVLAATAAFLVSAASDWIWQVPVLPVTMLLLASSVLAPLAVRGDGAIQTTPRRRIAVRVAVGLAAVVCLVTIGVPLAATLAMRSSQAQAAAGHPGAALTDARSALALEPGALSLELQIALVLESEGRLGGALQAARQASADEPENWQPWFIISRLEAESGHARAAVVAYRRSRALDPRSLLFHS